MSSLKQYSNRIDRINAILTHKINEDLAKLNLKIV